MTPSDLATSRGAAMTHTHRRFIRPFWRMKDGLAIRIPEARGVLETPMEKGSTPRFLLLVLGFLAMSVSATAQPDQTKVAHLTVHVDQKVRRSAHSSTASSSRRSPGRGSGLWPR